MTGSQQYIFTWPQVTYLSRLLTKGLPRSSSRKHEYAFMAVSSLGLRITLPAFPEGDVLVVENPREPGGRWDGYRQGQVYGLEWAPRTGGHNLSIIAEQCGENQWRVTYRPPHAEDANKTYARILALAAGYQPPHGKNDERIQLRRTLRGLSKWRDDKERYLTDCYNQLYKGLRESPEDPFRFLQSKSTLKKLKKFGAEWLAKALAPAHRKVSAT